MTKDTRIESEFNRLAALYKELPSEQMELMQPLIQNAAFMRITLEDLQEQVKKDGPVETYTNGANQSGRKQSSALQAYDRIIRDYTAVMKTLAEKVPAKKKVVPMAAPFTPREKSPEELAEEERQEREKQERLNREIERAQRILDEMHKAK